MLKKQSLEEIRDVVYNDYGFSSDDVLQLSAGDRRSQVDFAGRLHMICFAGSYGDELWSRIQSQVQHDVMECENMIFRGEFTNDDVATAVGKALVDLVDSLEMEIEHSNDYMGM